MSGEHGTQSDDEQAPPHGRGHVRYSALSASRFPAPELAPSSGNAILALHQERLAAFGMAAGTATELEGATVPGQRTGNAER